MVMLNLAGAVLAAAGEFRSLPHVCPCAVPWRPPPPVSLHNTPTLLLHHP